mgnify:CR=1 FL=1
MTISKYYKRKQRPTFASVLADKHVKAARECYRMVKFYKSVGDNVSATRWRVVMLEKWHDAARAEQSTWKNQRRAT